MTKLNLYEAPNMDEYLAIVTTEEFEQECRENGLRVVESIELEGDFVAWPTDRLLARV